MATTLKEPTSKKPAASPTAPKGSPPAGTTDPLAWLKARQKLVAVTGGALLALLLGGWFWTTAQRRKEEFANRALNVARSVAERGDFPTASSEFQRIIDTYRGSDAAREAEINLNQLRLINGQAELVIVRLREYLAGNPGPKYAPAANALLGAALENAGRPAEAAQAYEAAAGAAELDYLKAQYLLEAGRAHWAAGQADQAAAAYRRIMTDYSKTTVVTEAEVRLAEVTKGQM